MQCQICNSNKTKLVNTLPFYAKTGDEQTNIMLCEECGVFWRDFENKDFVLDNHYEISSYTNLDKEDELRKKRTPFFEQIVGLLDKYKKTDGKNLLDFGCSYGHLMDVAAKNGYKCTGVEIVDNLRDHLEQKYKVYKFLKDVPDDSMDLITCIDSLYCSPNPIKDILKISNTLKDNGLLIIRIANRSYMMKFYMLIRKKFDNKIMGDQLFVLNDKVIRILAEKANLTIKSIVYHENKLYKKSLLHKIGYDILPNFCKLTGIKITPGLIYVLQKEKNATLN
jgi:2-polyprenyl-3-methyl-5-hydroxy-6-metoxy-1,4-benzoquinol methylase